MTSAPSIRPPSFSFARLRGAEFAQLAAAITLGIVVFVPWYATNSAVVGANIRGHRGDVAAWAALPTLRWLLLAAAVAGLLSAWQTATDQRGAPGVHRGEMSAVVAVVVLFLVVFSGLIDPPGAPSSAVSLTAGWFVALACALVALAAASARLPRASRTPPGM